METIIIDENRLKIVLDRADTLKYAVNSDVAAEVARSIRNILKAVTESIGFSLYGNCFIEIYMSRDGGCELFITKTEDCSMYFPSGEKSEFDFGNEVEKSGVFVFYSLENVLSYFKELSNLKSVEKADVYFDREHDMFCVISDVGYVLAGEFGGELLSDIEKYYIEEHFEKIGDGTANTLASLAL